MPFDRKKYFKYRLWNKVHIQKRYANIFGNIMSRVLVISLTFEIFALSVWVRSRPVFAASKTDSLPLRHSLLQLRPNTKKLSKFSKSVHMWMTMFWANFYMISNSFPQHSRPVSNLFLQPFTPFEWYRKELFSVLSSTTSYKTLLRYATIHITYQTYLVCL